MSNKRNVGWFVLEGRDAKKRKIWYVCGWHVPYSIRQNINGKKTTKQDVIDYINRASPAGWVGQR